MSRRLWASAVALVALLATAGPARAQTETEPLGGYTLLARANPFQITYDSPGLLPVSPILQFSVPDAYTTLNTGPTGYSLASLAFPGPLLADLGTIMAQLPAECRSPTPIPPYPLRAEAFFPQGPTDTDTTPFPGTRMHAHADGPATRSFGAWNDAGMPGVFGVGSATGTSSTSGKGEEAVTKARSVVSGFSMLGGMIEIDSIVTDITATSTGEAGKTSGTTRVSGAAIGGQKVTIDEKGVSFAGTPTAGVAEAIAGIGKSLNEALLQSGISIKLFRHFETQDGGLAERIASGLVIELNYNGRTAPVFSQLLARIPSDQLPGENPEGAKCAPTTPQALVNLFKETHIESFALGGATVSANATPSFDFSGLGDTFVPDVAEVSGETLDAGGVSDLGDTLGSTGSGQSGAGVLASTGSSSGLFADGRAIPLALILLMLALFPLLGSLGKLFADGTLAAGRAAGICPLESEGDDDG